ncbi:MAG: hypothetical protein QW279_07780 [Candidatus Jordarchaeaceae archaeon]
MTDTVVENNEVGNGSFSRLEIASISLAVELGMDPLDAYNLICELKTCSPEYHRRIQEIAQLYLEARSALTYLLREIEKNKQFKDTQTQETPKISHDEETLNHVNIQNTVLETSHNIQQIETINQSIEKTEIPEKQIQEKAEEQILELYDVAQEQEKAEEQILELYDVAQEQEKAEEQILEKLREMAQAQTEIEAGKNEIVSQDVKVEIPIDEHTQEAVTSIESQTSKEGASIVEQAHTAVNASQDTNLQSKEEIEKWLSDIENHFEEMPVEKQEEIMPRYVQLRVLTCKDKKATGPSCIGCLIGNTIDCPLFNRVSKKK